MTHRERFHRVMNFQPVDRLPMIEWAGWWDQTLARWRNEGLPAELEDAFEIRCHLGLDPYQQCWIRPHGPGLPRPPCHGAGIITDAADYETILPRLYPAPAFDASVLRDWAQRQRRGELVVWISLDGFFWFPRTLLGIERHLYAFYDQAELMHRINADLLAYHHRVLDELLEILTPDFITFAEDMSYNHGPMISRELFEDFLAPYYRQLIPRLSRAGVAVLVDTDGDVTDLVEWMLSVGVSGLLPLERMAGVLVTAKAVAVAGDVAELRRRWPKLLMIGGFDKTVMHRGDQAVRAEFERLLPVMGRGGFIPSVDHQTPPQVSLAQYRRYVELLREYCRKAGGPRTQ